MSRTERRKRIKGTAAAVVASKKKRDLALPEGRHGIRTPPFAGNIAEAVLAGMCPWCGRGPWKVLAGHTSRSHGVSSRDLRDLAGFRAQDPICSPEFSERLRQVAAATGRVPPPAKRGRVIVLTPAGRTAIQDASRGLPNALRGKGAS